ncbi:MAG: ABC transporter ATP-binding protein [Thaumarchaeota archaeon]|nr:ABC transporter ATP-binding protein [Nitrososphaerota archaeon]
MASNQSVLSIENLQAGYGGVRVLHGVSMTVKERSVTVLLGTNGNGKSTLLKCLAGLVTPDAGSAKLSDDGAGVELAGMHPYEIVEAGVSLVPDGRRLFPLLTVEENLLMGAFKKSARKRHKENLKSMGELFPVLRERKGQLAGTLSGGEQQMLAIARALMSNPKLLLIDEPSLGLAPIVITKLMSTIKELRDKYGLTILMTEQNLPQAAKIADWGYIMVHGKIVFAGDAQQIHDNELVRRYYLVG